MRLNIDLVALGSTSFYSFIVHLNTILNSQTALPTTTLADIFQLQMGHSWLTSTHFDTNFITLLGQFD